MSDTDRHTPPPADAAAPDAALAALGRLVGTWTLGGDTEGTVRYEWMAGRRFLLQYVDFRLAGHAVRALEVIGRVHPFGGEPSPEIRSRAYDSRGHTLDYVYELEGDTLTIWGGEVGSPAYFRGTFAPGGDAMAGAWVWPGGGYQSTMTRVR